MMNLQYVTVIKDSYSWLQSVRNLFKDHMTLYYMKGLGVCHITGRRRKGKGLEVSCKYNYYCGPTKFPALIRDPAFIFVIMQFCPANKRDQAL